MLPTLFNYEDQQLRTVTRDGEPWFVAKDVCDILELGNSRMALERLDDDEKGVSSIDTLGGTQEMQVINEPGLYSLVLGSRKPEAKIFKRWITHEVIPQIRKTGTYSIQPMSQIQILQQAINVMAEQEKKLTAIEGTVSSIKDTIITQPDNWREDLNRMFNKIALAIGANQFQELRRESYKLLEQRARVDLERRLLNYKTRLLEQGASKTKIGQANKLDVIEQDPKLREIYAQIIKEYYIKHVA